MEQRFRNYLETVNCHAAIQRDIRADEEDVHWKHRYCHQLAHCSPPSFAIDVRNNYLPLNHNTRETHPDKYAFGDVLEQEGGNETEGCVCVVASPPEGKEREGRRDSMLLR